MRRERQSKDMSLDEKLSIWRKDVKQKLSEMKDREMEIFMTPGQKKRESIRRGKRRAKDDEREYRGFEGED